MHLLRSNTAQMASGRVFLAAAPGVPDAVSDLSGTNGDTEAVMSWTAPNDNGSAITDYVVQYREKP